MPKMKTNKSAAKRYRTTGTGKFKRGHAYHTHILTKKTSKRRRKLRKGAYVHTTLRKQMAKLLPYA